MKKQFIIYKYAVTFYGYIENNSVLLFQNFKRYTNHEKTAKTNKKINFKKKKNF